METEQTSGNDDGNSQRRKSSNVPQQLRTLCPRCCLPVYFAERRLANRRSWHAACFTCRVCGCNLDSISVATHLNEVFCNRCYGRTFGPRGYGFGMAGRSLSMTFTAMQDPDVQHVYHNPTTGLADEDSVKYSAVSHNSQKITFSKAYPHDNVITSNVPLTGIAHALPHLVHDETFRRRLGASKCSSLPPNTLSIIPKQRFQARNGDRIQEAAETQTKIDVPGGKGEDSANLEMATPWMRQRSSDSSHVILKAEDGSNQTREGYILNPLK